MLLVAVTGALILQMAGIYFPPLRELLGTQPLALSDLLIVGAAASVGYVAIRLDRILHPGVHDRPGERTTEST
jgi:Ca2+-transporting ATPase